MESERRVRRVTVINWAVLGSAVTFSIWIGIEFGHVLAGSDAALAGIVSVFSILAGVLVAVISIIGDPSMLLTGNWRVGYVHAEQIQIRLARYAHLVLIYVLILVLVLVAILIKDGQIEGMVALFQGLLALTTFGLLASLPLPYSLMSIQKERMREEIKRRKAAASNN